MAEVLYKIFKVVTKDVCDINSDVYLIQVGCRREAQTYQEMIDGNTHLSDYSLAWNPQNYKSCFAGVQEGDLNQPYEILNETGMSALIWRSEGVYIFRATMVDPEYRLVVSRF